MSTKEMLMGRCKKGHLFDFDIAFSVNGWRDLKNERMARCPGGCEEVVHEKDGIKLNIEKK